MKASERKQALMQQTGNLRVEFTEDDEIKALVIENTRGITQRTVSNIVKCLTLIAGGTSLSTSCKLTGISLARLNHWRSKEWYARAIEMIKQRLDDQLDGKFTHAINKGMDKLHHRLDKGDPVVNNRTGEITYKPVSAKDAAIITSIFFDKRNLLRNKPTTITSSQSTEERLVMLAGKFKEIAVDAEYTVVDSDMEEIKEDEQVEIIETHKLEAPKAQSEAEDTSKWSFSTPQGQDEVHEKG